MDIFARSFEGIMSKTTHKKDLNQKQCDMFYGIQKLVENSSTSQHS